MISQEIVPSGQMLMSASDASSLAWPADVVFMTFNWNPASCHSFHHHMNRNADKKKIKEHFSYI
jgi:hypothetical protein